MKVLKKLWPNSGRHMLFKHNTYDIYDIKFHKNSVKCMVNNSTSNGLNYR